MILLLNCWIFTYLVQLNKKGPKCLILMQLHCFIVAMHALLLCRIFGLKIWLCKIFDKTHVWIRLTKKCDNGGIIQRKKKNCLGVASLNCLLFVVGEKWPLGSRLTLCLGQFRPVGQLVVGPPGPQRLLLPSWSVDRDRTHQTGFQRTKLARTPTCEARVEWHQAWGNLPMLAKQWACWYGPGFSPGAH